MLLLIATLLGALFLGERVGPARAFGAAGVAAVALAEFSCAAFWVLTEVQGGPFAGK